MAGLVMDPPDGVRDDEPVLIHVTVCPAHVSAVRKWLRAKTPIGEDSLITIGTEYLLREWGQIVDPIELPVYGLTKIA